MNGFPPRHPPTATSPGGNREHPRSDPLRRGVQMLLMLYLLPAVLVVLVLGGLLVLFEGLVGACAGGSARTLLGRGSRVRFLTAGGDGRSCDLPADFPGVRPRDLAPVRGRRGD